MITSRDISTISFNSTEYLISILNDCIDAHIISFYAFIKHLPEQDEKKEHIHLYVVPNGRLDTDALRGSFTELVDSNSLPLGCLPFNYTKWQEWYLYVLHDEKYLASKNDSRKYHYNDSDLYVSDEVYFSELKHSMNLSKYLGLERFIEAVSNGMSFTQCLCQGLVPVQLLKQYEAFYSYLKGSFPEEKPQGVVKGGILPPNNNGGSDTAIH